jgi:hypothetical protein
MNEMISKKRAAYITLGAIFIYCFQTIFSDRSPVIESNFKFFLVHKIIILVACIAGMMAAYFNKAVNSLNDFIFWICITYVCFGELFYPGYNLAYIQLILIIPLILNMSSKKTFMYIGIAYVSFNISLIYGQSKLVEAKSYQTFFLDTFLSTLTATLVSLGLCLLVKRIREQKTEEMKRYYSLGLQSAVFVHDAKSSLFQAYRDITDSNSKMIIETSIYKFQEIIKNSIASEESLFKESLNEVLIEISRLYPNVEFNINGDERKVQMPSYHLKSVLMNLISNSIQSCIESNVHKPQLKILIKKDCFQLLDNGPGFSDEILKNFGNNNSNHIFGTGVGLKNTIMLVAIYGGHISLKNRKLGALVNVNIM